MSAFAMLVTLAVKSLLTCICPNPPGPHLPGPPNPPSGPPREPLKSMYPPLKFEALSAGEEVGFCTALSATVVGCVVCALAFNCVDSTSVPATAARAMIAIIDSAFVFVFIL